MFFKSFNLSKKLALGFILSTLMTLILGVTSLYQFNKLSIAVNEINTNAIPSIILAEKIRYSISSMRRLEAQAVLTLDATERESLISRIGKEEEHAKGFIKEYFPMIVDAEDKTGWENVNNLSLAYFEFDHLLIQKLKEPQLDMEALTTIIFKTSREGYSNAMTASAAMIKYNTDYADILSGVANKTKKEGIQIVIGMIILSTILSILLAVKITKSITVPILEAVKVAGEICDGDLTSDIMKGDIHSKSETVMLSNSLSSMQENLTNLVLSIRESADGIKTSSAEIASGNNDLSARTENQASALEETAASMEELSSTVKQNAESAKHANTLAMGVATGAIAGSDVVDKVVSTMKDIDESSKKISDIINVIDSIAFQTNILALNAAVEAARAGEQGRGFAVVATEVRNLAQKSAAAAKEIKSLIIESSDRVTIGVDLANNAGVKMTEIVSSIQNLATIMSEISNASTEQAQGVSQVGEAIIQMDEVTQQNAALVEEMAAASTHLSQQAMELTRNVALFKTS
jgi:methyl-accepting chemotaxis protein